MGGNRPRRAHPATDGPKAKPYRDAGYTHHAGRGGPTVRRQAEQ